MSLSDATYFRDRALAERALAAATSDPAALAAHCELAERYEALVTAIEGGPVRLASSGEATGSIG